MILENSGGHKTPSDLCSSTSSNHPSTSSGIFDSPQVQEANGIPPSNNSYRKRIYLVSAKDPESGKRYAGQVGAYLGESSASDEDKLMGSLARTLGERRSLLPIRTAVVAANIQELTTTLLNGNLPFSRSSKKVKIAFVFTGQGAQWAGMGRELINCYPVFKEALTAAEECLKKFGAQWSLIGMLIISPGFSS